MIDQARAFAIGAHEAIGQKRKFTGEPYWKHLERVAATVTGYGGSQYAIAAAWLHDTVEDTKVTSQIIHDQFGFLVGMNVDFLTNNKDVSRDESKALELERFRTAPAEACNIKLADILDNGKCCLTQGDSFYTRRFMQEKTILIDILKDGANQDLWREVNAMIAGYWRDKN